MLEYVFFDRRPWQKFVDFVEQQGLTPKVTEDDGTYEVGLPEDLDDALSDLVEDYYAQMMDLNQALYEAGESEDGGYHAAGVVVTLSGGNTVYAQVRPDLLSRLMAVLAPEELGELVNAVVDAVENPDERSMCQRIRDGAAE